METKRNESAASSAPDCAGRNGAHTPGRWELRVNGMFLRIVHGEHKTTVADGIVSEANARLIAASPDLLAALITALPYIECAEEDDAYKPGVVKAVTAKLRAAIALATQVQS